MKHVASGLMIAVLLAGCSFEPNYVRPDAPVPPGWPVGDAYLKQSEATLPTVSYRDIFRDPRLQSVIEQALDNNRDLRVAAANIAAARAQYRIQRADLLPNVGATADVAITRDRDNGSSGNGGGNNAGSNNDVSKSYSVGLGLTGYEIDLFGRVRSLSHAALQRYFATEAAARATRLALVSDIASTYLALAADRSRLAIARETEANATRAADLTGARLRGGIAPRTELRQAQTILDQARSDSAELTTAVAQDRNALDLLVGAPVDPALLPESLESVDGLLSELPAGLSSEILLRRPDVVQAEYQLRAANAEIGAARAAFFPRISLTAVAGFASTALSSLFSGGSFGWTVAPEATLPIFDGGANRGNLALARAQRELALAQYEKAIQTAFRDVADALARRGTIDAQFSAQSDLVAHASDTYRLAYARYREGIDQFLTTLDSQRTLYAAQNSLVAARLERADNLVQLYRALGGDALIEGPFDTPPLGNPLSIPN
jgi:multidrug efflux system outer membrane protein